MYGFHGKLLRVNLTSKSAKEETIPEQILRKFLGGRGLGAKILFDELAAKIDPLGSDNKLIFLTGPFTGLPVVGASRYIVMAKSPLTRSIGEANAGGFFPRALKWTGYDAIIFEGKSASPVYVFVDEGKVEFRDARHLWGKLTAETDLAIQAEAGEDVMVACIGPAGEKLVKFASVMSEGHRACARTGMGAVMGSKNLKALAVHGARKPAAADEQRVREINKSITDKVNAMPNTAVLRKYGTAGTIDHLNTSGSLPTQNFREATFEGTEKINGATAEAFFVKSGVCPYCPVGCDKIMKIADTPYGPVLPEYGSPEYETLGAFGPLCCNDDLKAIAAANQICNSYGMDTISTGVAVAFAIECKERGLIQGDGIDLRWGNGEAIVKLTELIARREGLGDLLAEGVKVAAQKIGRGSEHFAMHSKGLEFSLHEPRSKKALALTYATSFRGATHMEALQDPMIEKDNALPEFGFVKGSHRFSYEQKPEFAKLAQEIRSVWNSLICCYFTTFASGPNRTNQDLADMLSAVTGWNVSLQELMQTGERIINLCRAFMAREGLGREVEILPARVTEPITKGVTQGQFIDPAEFEKMKDRFYEVCGWDSNGVPKTETLKRLGLKPI